MGPQETGGGTHVVDRLESYLLGDLSADMEFDVEEHILRCADCRVECDRMSTMALLVSGLPEAAVAEKPEPAGPVPPPAAGTTQPTSAGPTPAKLDGPDTTRPSLHVLPGGRRSDPPVTPATPRRERRARLLVAAALVLGLVVGSAGWALLAPQSLQSMLVGNGGPPADLADRVTLTVDDGPDGTARVTAVVVGLPPGASFTLLAVTADASYVVVRDEAGGGPQRLVGDVPVPADRVLLVVVALADGTVVGIGLP
jgi:hypothetical protein